MCGIIGVIYNKEPAVFDAYIGLMNEQHRGKEAAGIVTLDGNKYHDKFGIGEVAQVFPDDDSLEELVGSAAIGQTRYATTGGSIDQTNLQPIAGYFHGRPFYIAHNGNIVNLNEDNTICKKDGVSDTYLVAQKIMVSKKKGFVDALIETFKGLKGSFSFIILFEGHMYVAKDRYGFCPLVFGKKNGGYVVASETCALDMIGASEIRDVLPGEMLIISAKGFESIKWTTKTDLKFAIFEFIYFLRPDSIIFGVHVGLARQFTGRRMAKRYGCLAPMMMPVPDSANDLFTGYASEIIKTNPSVILQQNAFFRSHYVGRTFLQAIQSDRERLQRQKFHTSWPLFLGADEVLVLDDSLIRSTVVRGRIKDLRALISERSKYSSKLAKDFGIKKIHFLVGSPPYAYPDYYGVDTYREGEELAIKSTNGDIPKLAEKLGLATLGYADLEEDVIGGILDAQEFMGISNHFTQDSFYTGPFTGIYPDGTGLYCR